MKVAKRKQEKEKNSVAEINWGHEVRKVGEVKVDWTGPAWTASRWGFVGRLLFCARCVMSYGVCPLSRPSVFFLRTEATHAVCILKCDSFSSSLTSFCLSFCFFDL